MLFEVPEKIRGKFHYSENGGYLEEPYTEEDLNYNDSGSRASMEQNDPEARPAIAGDVYPIDSYDVVFLGYPIWLAYHKLIQCTQIA